MAKQMTSDPYYITWSQMEAEALKTKPPVSGKLIASWFVYDMPNQNSRRSQNSTVKLRKGQVARVRVELPPKFRSKVAFTLIHDKRRARDQARTGPLQHGHKVDGNAHDWPKFGNRIYIGRVLYPGGQKELWKHIVGFRVSIEALL